MSFQCTVIPVLEIAPHGQEIITTLNTTIVNHGPKTIYVRVKRNAFTVSFRRHADYGVKKISAGAKQ